MLSGFDPQKERDFELMTAYSYLFHLETLVRHNKKENDSIKEAPSTRKKTRL